MPQVRFLLDHEGSVLVNRIGRLEALNEDGEQIFEALGIPSGHFPDHANRSKRKVFCDYYSNCEFIDMIAISFLKI
mgnify:CR=1 FL=1